jgi:hypothetical protein
MTLWLTLLFFLFAPLSFAAEDDIDGFVARIYRNASGKTMPYRLFIPQGYSDEKRYPLVIWLHGAGGAGTDNIAQISEDQILGTHTWTEPQNQAKYPAFVLAPQSPGNWVEELNRLSPEMRLLLEILDSVKSEFKHRCHSYLRLLVAAECKRSLSMCGPSSSFCAIGSASRLMYVGVHRRHGISQSGLN